MRKLLLNTLLFVLVAALSACSTVTADSDADLGERPIRVVTTIGMITDIAENVGGERVEVTGLMGPGIDPHLYRATEGDVSTLQSADLILYNGLHLEAQMTDIFERMNDQGIRTKAVTDNIDRAMLQAPPEFAGNYDPHVWFDVQLWISAAETVRDTLIEMDPTHADVYRENADHYLTELQELDAYARQQAERVPVEKRVLVTAHDAFNYFGRAYGFEVRGLQGISTESEAGTADVQELASFIAERRIPAVFVESSVPRRNIEAVQAAVQAQGFNVEIGGELFSDAMGNPGTAEGTYIGMVRHNVDTIVNALLEQ